MRPTGLGSIPAASDLVWECLRRDYRWDWQVDDRYVYLARLVRDLRLDMAGLDRQLRACGPRGSYDEPDPHDVDNQFGLAEGVLTTLALSGDADARTLLRDYVRDGVRWAETLATISYDWPQDWWDDLREVAAERLDPSIDLEVPDRVSPRVELVTARFVPAATIEVTFHGRSVDPPSAGVALTVWCGLRGCRRFRVRPIHSRTSRMDSA